MKLERISFLKSKKEILLFLSIILFVLSYSLLIEYHNYKTLTRFDSNIVTATILKQYKKTKLTKKGNFKTYQVLKLKSDSKLVFYTITKNSFKKKIGKKISLEIWAGDISFYQYLTTFFVYSKVLSVDNNLSLKEKLNHYLDSKHKDSNISNIYKALYTATPLNFELQHTFSNLGISHLLAISGFHLGVLSFILFFILKYPYTFFQNRFFTYRNSNIDIFIIIAILLLTYMIFLDSPPSLLRAFSMFIIGFYLYDRGFKIISMQTLFLTTILLLAFFPRLIFSLGFWLSIFGVFYIFLFLVHFKHINKIWQYILIPIWIYFMMLPYTLSIFHTFSIYHPLSIIWSMLFTLFYPLSILFHIIGFGDALDSILLHIIRLGNNSTIVESSFNYLIIDIILSYIAIFKKNFIYILILFNLFYFLKNYYLLILN